jgi:hypothetical protein
MQTSSNSLLPNMDIVFAIRQTMQHVYGFANTRLDKPFDINNNSASKQSNIFQSSNAYSIPIDELRLYVEFNYLTPCHTFAPKATHSVGFGVNIYATCESIENLVCLFVC